MKHAAEMVTFGTFIAEKPKNGIYKKADDMGSGVGYFRMGDLFRHSRIPSRSTEYLLAPLSESEFAKHKLKRGDLLFCRTSVAPEGVGKCSIVQDERSPLVPASNLIRVRVDQDVGDPRFLYYYFSTDLGRRSIRSFTRGAAVYTITGSDIASVPVPFLSLNRQRAIGGLFERFDDLIENNRRRIEILEEMARLIYREWFVDFRFPGHEDVEFVESALGPTPEGWKVAAFSDLADFLNGFAFKSSEHWTDVGLPIVKIKELKNGVTRDTPRYHGEDVKKRYFVDDGDVLFSWSADLDAYIWSGGPALLNQHLFVVRPYELSNIFLFHSLRGRMEEFRARSQGTTMKHIKRSALTEVRAVVPDEGARRLFENAVGPMLDLQLNLTRQNRTLADARDLFLPRLVSGEFDVSDLDLDLEPLA